LPALIIDIDQTVLKSALDFAIASSKRAANTSKRPEFKVVYERELAELERGKASIVPFHADLREPTADNLKKLSLPDSKK